MQIDQNGTPVFVIGLTMAGAISAGAYTAGVLDFLMRAMKAHNERVRRGPTPADPAPPRHRVVLQAMSGASAGGMCTGLAMGALIQAGGAKGAAWEAPLPIRYDAEGGPAESGYVLAPVWEAWVDRVTLWDRDTGQGLLALDDMRAEVPSLDAGALAAMDKRPVVSVLNGLHLDEVARGALAGVTAWPGGDGAEAAYDFIARDLDLFLTTTALNGVVYEITFEGAPDRFTMEQHGIARHFRVSGLGVEPLPSPWLDAWADRGIALDLGAAVDGRVPFAHPDNPGNWLALTVAALATGAFPVGLMPRYVAAQASDLGMLDADGAATGGALPLDIDPDTYVVTRPAFPTEIGAAQGTPYVAVDGGAINNEPFEIARYAIRAAGPDGRLLANPRGADDAHRAVLMIDPFPEGVSYAPLTAAAATRLASLTDSTLKLLPTLIAQARFKPVEVVQARNPKVRSRFMIAPARTAAGGSQATGAAAIASGALGGFGGFFDHGFRQHDFLLGQRNCQRFLQAHFTIAAHNPVLGLGLDAPAEESAWVLLPVIDPGPGLLAREIRQPLWPRIGAARLRDILAQGQVRITEVGRKLLKGQKLNAVRRWLIGRLWDGIVLLWTGGLRGLATRTAARAVLADFILRGQHESFAALGATDRALMALLVGVGDEYVTPAVLRDAMQAAAEAHKLPPGASVPETAAIEKRLEAFRAQGWAEKPWTDFRAPFRYRFALGL